MLAIFIAATLVAADPPRKAEEIEVQVLAILASEHHKDVHPKLTRVRQHVQKKDANLTGFRLDRTNVDELELGETKKFPLVGKEVVEVTVNKERNEKGRITLTIKPPGLEQITYECACDKFFSVATKVLRRQGEGPAAALHRRSWPSRAARKSRYSSRTDYADFDNYGHFARITKNVRYSSQGRLRWNSRTALSARLCRPL